MPTVYKDESGKIIEVKMDEVITDPDHPLAVQIPVGVNGAAENAIAPLLEPSVNERNGDSGHPNEGDEVAEDDPEAEEGDLEVEEDE